MSRFLRRFMIIFGLPVLAYGLYVSVNTIRLYAFGSETQGTVVGFQVPRSTPRSPPPVTNRAFGTTAEDRRPAPQRIAIVRYATEQGETESPIRIRLDSTIEWDEPVTVVYLPGPSPMAIHLPGSSWSAIRGEPVYENIVLMPLFTLMIGCLVTGFALTPDRPIFIPVRKRTGTILTPDTPPARPSGILDAIGVRLFKVGLIAVAVGIPGLILVEIGSHFWKSHQKEKLAKIRHEETMRASRVADGVKVEPPNIQDPAKLCPPMKIGALNRATASGGDIIELQGNWGALTSNKVPEMRGRRAVRRLKVIEWTANAIRLEVPAGLEPGSYSVGVRCYFRPDQPKSRIRYSGSLKIQIK